MAPPIKTRVAEIFEDSNEVSRKAVVTGSIILVVFVIALRLYAVSFSVKNFFDATSIQFFTNTSLAVITSLLAAWIFAYAFRVKDNTKLARLRSIGPDGYIPSFLQKIDSYNRSFVEDYKANVKFQEHASGELLSVTISFEYKKSPIRNPLEITIHRLIGGADDPETLKLIAHERVVKEYVWQQDERTFPVAIDSRKDYAVEAAYVGENSCGIRRTDEKDKITFTFGAPSAVDTTSQQSVEYRVRLPFEKESVLQLTHDFPTFNAEIEVDYREVKDLIDVYVFTMAGIEDNPIPRDTDDPCLIRYKYRGWLNPQNGYVVTWWRK